MAIEISMMTDFKEVLDKFSQDIDTHGLHMAEYLANELALIAKQICPVRTGRLRDSIRVEPGEERGVYYVIAGGIEVRGVFVNYAVYQEYGTRYIAPRWYMHNAIEILKSMVQGGMM